MWCTAQRKGRPKLQSHFSLFVDQSSPDYVTRRGRDRSLQRRLLIVDILFQSGDIRDRSAKSSEIAPKACFRSQIFFGEDPQILDLFFKIAPISDHVAKFRGDRPRDRGDLALNKKRKKETAAKKGSRVALSQRAAVIIIIIIIIIKIPHISTLTVRLIGCFPRDEREVIAGALRLPVRRLRMTAHRRRLTKYTSGPKAWRNFVIWVYC